MISVKEIKPINKGNLKAVVCIEIDGTTFRDLRIVQQPNKNPWISAPQKSWVDDQGKTHYMPLIEFSKELKNQISDTVLKAWNN